MRFCSLACSLWPLSLLALLACGDKSAVSLTVYISDASVSAQDGTLGATLGGSFSLQLELGPEASGPTTVTLGDFALQTSAGAPLIDPLPLDAGSVSFPLVVGKGGKQTVSFTLNSKKLLTTTERDALCAGQVIIVGSVMDSLKGGTDPLQSMAIVPTCS